MTESLILQVVLCLIATHVVSFTFLKPVMGDLGIVSSFVIVSCLRLCATVTIPSYFIFLHSKLEQSR